MSLEQLTFFPPFALFLTSIPGDYKRSPFSLQMAIEEVNSPSGCFPRLDFRQNIDDTSFYVCPKAGGVAKTLVQIIGDKQALLQVSNKDLEDFTTEVLFISKWKWHRRRH